MSRFTPTYTFRGISDIPEDFFRRNNIKYVVSDIDNTLVADNDPDPDETALEFLARLEREGIKVGFLSNNSKKRVEVFSQGMSVPRYHRAAKPFAKRLKRLMAQMGADKSSTVIIGDQLFTDILCGNRAGIRTVLVTPINAAKENMFFKLKRYLERKLMKREDPK